MGQVRQRVTLGLAAFGGDGFVAAGEADGLEGEKSDFFRIVESELDDASDLFVVDAVDNLDYRDDFYPGAMQVVDGFQLHVEQIADFAVRVGSVANAVELQIRV